jgi:hypothetical protein
MTVASAGIYAMMFAAGYWIYGRVPVASVMTIAAVVFCGLLFPILKKLNSKGK